MKVGLVLLMTEDEAGIARYRELRDLACHAERAGFDSVWVVDHILFRFPGQPTRGAWEAATVAAGISEATSTVEVGALVMCTAFRNPVLLAKTAVTLDEISDGRLVLGLGAGWHAPELTAAGLPVTRLVSRFEEATQIIVALLRDGRADFTGQYYSAPDCELRPTGPRPAAIPVLIGGEGPRVMRLAARFGDAWNTAWHTSPDSIGGRLDAFAAARRDEGSATRAVEATAGLNVFYRSADGGQPDDALLKLLDGALRLGVDHVICDLKPLTHESIDWLADHVTKVRASSSEVQK
jgi:alkanesulfonate monooxygenase SsuD/methylene tetrahydromethanopterin reductase-like flavin-dependent oxidoreductase (luciferase family)